MVSIATHVRLCKTFSLTHTQTHSFLSTLPTPQGTIHDRQPSSARFHQFHQFHQIKMLPTVFEHLLSCRSCNSAVLIEDPFASRSTITAAGTFVGLVIRHEIRDHLGSVSWLELFPFTANHPLSKSPQGSTEQQSISRQFICMEDSATPESRRQIAKEWGLRWVSFEQHFETIAAWSGRTLGECPCECHKWHTKELGCADGETVSEGDECTSINTTLAVVGQESDRCSAKPGGRETGYDDGRPTGWPIDGRDRARSEEISHTDQWVLSWREQCWREQSRRDSN